MTSPTDFIYFSKAPIEVEHNTNGEDLLDDELDFHPPIEIDDEFFDSSYEEHDTSASVE